MPFYFSFTLAERKWEHVESNFCKRKRRDFCKGKKKKSMKHTKKFSSIVYLEKECHMGWNKREDLYPKSFQLVKLVKLKNYPTVFKLLRTDERNVDTKIKYTPGIHSTLIKKRQKDNSVSVSENWIQPICFGSLTFSNIHLSVE